MILISILNWNRTADTVATLGSLMADGDVCTDAAIVVIDNHSAQSPASAVRQLATTAGWNYRAPDEISELDSDPPLPRQVVVIRSHANLGFAGGHNRVLNRAKAWGADYVLIVNNDCVAPRGLVRSLLNIAGRHSRVGIVGCRLIDDGPEDNEQYGGGRRYWRLGVHLMRRWKGVRGVRQVNFVPGCIALLDVGMVHDVGAYDERYFVYVEDACMSYRAGRAGWRQFVNLDISAAHGFSKSLGRRSPGYYYYVTRNTLLMIRDELRAGEKLTAFPCFLLQTAARWALFRVQGRNGHARAVSWGVRDFLTNQFGMGPSWVHPEPSSPSS